MSGQYAFTASPAMVVATCRGIPLVVMPEMTHASDLPPFLIWGHTPRATAFATVAFSYLTPAAFSAAMKASSAMSACAGAAVSGVAATLMPTATARAPSNRDGDVRFEIGRAHV